MANMTLWAACVIWPLLLLFFFFKSIYLFRESEKESEQGRGRERGRENPKQALCCQRRARCRA